MRGRVCVVTGGNRGLGRAISNDLASMGAIVVLACRNVRSAVATRESIVRRTGNHRVHILECDISSMASVRTACKELDSTFARLDVLVHCTGSAPSEKTITDEGHERTLAIDLLGPFLATHLWLDLLRGATPSRVVVVTSQKHRSGVVDFEDLSFERRAYSAKQAIEQAQLGRVLFTMELARRLRGSGVTAHCVDPGLVRTESLRHASLLARAVARTVLRPIYRSPRVAAEGPVHVATSPALTNETGLYFRGLERQEPAPLVHDRELGRQLWETCERLVGIRNSVRV